MFYESIEGNPKDISGKFASHFHNKVIRQYLLYTPFTKFECLEVDLNQLGLEKDLILT